MKIKNTLLLSFTLASLMSSAAAPDAERRGFVVATDFLPADGKTNVSDAIQRLIDANPNREIFFPDGT